MLDKMTSALTVVLAFILSSSEVNAIWDINNVSSSYMSGATIACSGPASTGTATIQQEYTANYGQNWTAFGSAPAVNVSGTTWSQSLTATVVQNANAYRVKLSPSAGAKKITNTYTVF